MIPARPQPIGSRNRAERTRARIDPLDQGTEDKSATTVVGQFENPGP